MSEKKNLLDAKEARKLAEESYCQINRIAREIELSAKENRDIIHWAVYDTNRKALDNIIATLVDAGYGVTVEYEQEVDETLEHMEERPESLVITW